jgi:hypothetical protein
MNKLMLLLAIIAVSCGSAKKTQKPQLVCGQGLKCILLGNGVILVEIDTTHHTEEAELVELKDINNK